MTRHLDTPRLREIFPIPHDYPIKSKFTVFWFGESETALPDDLMEWIRSGEPPLLLTFGSMPFKAKFDQETAIIKLTEQLDTRIIVVRGWGLDRTEKLDLPPKIKVIDSAPYESCSPLPEPSSTTAASAPPPNAYGRVTLSNLPHPLPHRRPAFLGTACL